MEIKQAAKLLGITESVLRFYEEKGIVKPKRKENGYREYTDYDINQLQIIVQYRKLGFSIKDIKKIFEVTMPDIIGLYFQQQKSLNKQIKELQFVHQKITKCLDHLLYSNNFQSDHMSGELKSIIDDGETQRVWEDHWSFDEWASTYDQAVYEFQEGLPFYEHYDDVLDQTAFIVNEHIGNVLEIGIGTGNLAKRIQDQQELYGIDQSVQMLIQAKRKLRRVKLRYGTFMEIPFEDGFFNTIVSSYAFHHCDEVQREYAIQEMDRVLQEHGRIIITDLMFESSAERLTYESICTKQQKADLIDEHFSNIDQIIKQFHALHYQIKTLQLDNLIWCITAYK